MTVPALDTSFIGTFAYIQPATEVQIADVLPYLHAYQQYPEYVDGVMRIFDAGGTSGYYCDCYVRVRTDGWMMAFFPDDANQGSACWGSYAWVLGDYNNRGDLVWWGHTHTTTGNPTADSTRLGRALSEMWTQLAANSDTPGYSFAYTDVGYYDYVHTSSSKIYLFGAHIYKGAGAGSVNQYFYFTVPAGTTIQAACASHGYYEVAGCCAWYARAIARLNNGTAKAKTFFDDTTPTGGVAHQSAGFVVEDVLASHVYDNGTQNEGYIYGYAGSGGSNNVRVNLAFVILASG